MTKDDSRIVKDPICGKDVDTLRARAVGIFGGVTYYFCSAECKAKYQDPRQTPRPPVEAAAPAKVLVATDSPKRKAEKAAEKARAEKADPSVKIAKPDKSDKSGRVPKVEPAAVAPAAEVKAAPKRSPTAPISEERVVDFVAEPSSHFEQAEELTPIPTSRRRFPLLALLLLALLVAGGVVLFTLKHK